MRIPPLLADFIYNRGCELKCEKFLTRPFLRYAVCFLILKQQYYEWGETIE